MNEPEHRRLREQLGAFALGALHESESAAVRAHLDGCAACRAEYEQIAPLAGLLDRVDPDHLDSRTAAAPPPGLGDEITRRIRAERARRSPRPSRRRPAVAVAGVVAAAACFVAGYVFAPDPPPAVPVENVAIQQQAPGLQASADLVAHTWGMEVKLTGRGFAEGETYRVVVVDDRGREVGAGQFVGVGTEEMRCNLNSSVLRADAAAFRVVRAADPGTVVLSSDLT